MIKVKHVAEIMFVGVLCYGPVLYFNYTVSNTVIENYGTVAYAIVLIVTNLLALIIERAYFKKRTPMMVREKILHNHRKYCLNEYKEIKNSLILNGHKYIPSYIRLMAMLSNHEHVIKNCTNGKLLHAFMEIKNSIPDTTTYIRLNTDLPPNSKTSNTIRIFLEYKIDDLIDNLNKLKPGI